jgi:hypothetical protein
MHPVESCLAVASSRTTPSTNCVHPVCLRHRRGIHGRPHRRARRAGIPSILFNPVCWWPHREARHAPTACILSVRGIVGGLVEGLIIEDDAQEPAASFLLLSGRGLIDDHATHQLRASCLCGWHCQGACGRPHCEARRPQTSCILCNPVWRWPRREAHHAQTGCILSVCGIAAKLMKGLVVEHAAHKPQACCLILSGGSLVDKHATHQLRASCLCVALSGVSWTASS